MARLSQVMDAHANLSQDERSWLTAMVREWHLLSDTAFSDLVLWLPDAEDEETFWAAAQVRPVTGPTALKEDVVGSCISYESDSLVCAAYMTGEVMRDSDNNVAAGIPVDTWAIPVMRRRRCIAVVECHTNQMGVRAPGALEESYMTIAHALCDMLHNGCFPINPPSDPTMSPKVGDGIMLIDTAGELSYASPNAISSLRRLGLEGDLIGEEIASHFPEEIASYVRDEFRECREFEMEHVDTVFRVRAIPLTYREQPISLLILCRDVTQLMERERMLVNKDATIREIHHRVKNNLQTVAALLRLQARRLDSPESKAALSDAQRRVQSIAAVHEILSQSFDDVVNFDAIADQILRMVADVASASGGVRVERRGSFGQMPGDVATSLSLVMTELCQNAIEHGLRAGGGHVIVAPQRDEESGVVLEVIDDGGGLPDGFSLESSSSLGLSIVSTLVADLSGTFSLESNADRGATARVHVLWA